MTFEKEVKQLEQLYNNACDKHNYAAADFLRLRIMKLIHKEAKNDRLKTRKTV